MHWTLGKRRLQEATAVEAARTTAKATRVAAALGIAGTVVALGGSVAAAIVVKEPPAVRICTAIAITDYSHLYDSGSITEDEYQQLRADAIADQINDIADC